MEEAIDVVILAGGKGSRLRTIVSDRPKPMAEIEGKPFLDILLNHFRGMGLGRFILCTGERADFIEDYYKKKKEGDISFSREPMPLGTGGAIKNAEALINSDPFFVVNGDSFCKVYLPQFTEFHKQKGALLSIVLIESDNTNEFGSVYLDHSNRIIGFEEKEEKNGISYINAGIYLFKKEILCMIPANTKYSLEYDLFPKLVGKEMYGFPTKAELVDIGTPARYEYAKRFFDDKNEKKGKKSF
ncbi:hypothetical protein A3A76_00340 [Candidatus Woesebacteria bacterium RIFCSPLOWO2_01_FULL_39_23]|nr:MAG: hypothetical protein A3A76_00340 [Candidatus Woesebacteria bacterium RIFCSPLOWO2_01_FULL_39_23]